MIKVIMSLQKNRIYKNLNFNRLNPNITMDDTRIALHNRTWNTDTNLNCAGVNAFGFSGTNAHVILQEFPTKTLQRETLSPKINVLVLSAKTQTALDNLAKCYQHFLATTAYDFNDICFTAATCRDHYTYRLAIAATCAIEASQCLERGAVASLHGKNNRLDLHHDIKLEALVTDYLQGKIVNWIAYYETYNHPLIKVVLPHYTFDRNVFWLEKRNGGAVQNDSMSPLLGPMDKERGVTQSQFFSYESALQHLYEVKWSTLSSSLRHSTNVPDLWVISKDEMRAQKVFGAMPYQRVDTMEQLDSVEQKHIVFLYEQEQFNDLFQCCQRMFKCRPASFVLVTENAYAVDNHPLNKVNPYHTMASAFWKSFRNELELDRNYLIDLDSNSTASSTIDYALNTTSEETQFAVRDSIYVPRLKKKQLSINPALQEIVFDSEASYLITGGTGGLARPLIKYLIHRGTKNIIITGRTKCSIDTQELIDNARKKQVYIQHYTADASNAQQMEPILETIKQRTKPLKGVFHLAGIIHDELIVNLGDDAVQRVLDAKMESALLLHELTQEIPLDLFVLFSSSASILGSRGQSNYVAANGFLDGLAHLRQQQGLPALAINWGAFHSIGMAAKNIHTIQKRGLIPLGHESMDILDVLLPMQLPQIVVCPIHWDVYLKNTPKQIELSEQVKNITLPDQVFIAFLRQHTDKEQVAILSSALCEITADVLRLDNIEQVGIKHDLFAMGMDSLTSLELRNRIHDKLQCPTLSLPIEYFINEPRIDKIARNIVKELNTIVAPAHHNLLAENSPIAPVALCDTQYVFWMIEKLGASFNCGMQLQLHGNLNKEYLSEAFAFAIHQNDVFWLNFSVRAPIQMLNRQEQFKLIYKDISLDYDKDTLNDAFYANVMRTIPLTNQPLIRVYLYKLAHEHHELHIMIPHIILDDSSYRILFDQFRKNYESLILGKQLSHIPEKHTYLDFVKQNNSHYEKDLKDKVDFWTIYNQGFQSLSFGRIHHLPDAANREKNLFHYPMDKQLIEKFKDWHKERNINVSTGIIAACQIAFYRLSRQKKIPIMILHSGREGSRYRSVVGLFTEYKRLNITLNEAYKFIDFLKSIEEQLLKTAPYQKCSQLIKSAGLRDARLSIGQHLVYQYNKFFLSKPFKDSKLHSITCDYYLRRLGMLKWNKTKAIIKYNLNKRFQFNLPLSKPSRVRVLINITASFFIKEPRGMSFTDLDITIPNHYGSVDRPIGNQTLWLYFTKDQYNDYRLSINGPLTTNCKDQIARELNHVMTRILENDEQRISDLA